MAGAFSNAFSTAFDIDTGGGAAAARPEEHRRSARRKRKPQTIYLPGTEPAKPEPVVIPVGITIAARETGQDRAVILASARFLPVIAAVLAREPADAARIPVKVTGIGYDEDDLEVLALAMGAD